MYACRSDGGSQLGTGRETAGAFQPVGDDRFDTCSTSALRQFDAGQQPAVPSGFDDQAPDERVAKKGIVDQMYRLVERDGPRHH